MIIDIWSREIKPDKIEEALTFFKGFGASVSGKYSGIVRSMTGFDHATNKLIMVSIWESAEAKMAMVTNPEFLAMVGSVEHFYATAMETQEYELVYSL